MTTSLPSPINVLIATQSLLTRTKLKQAFGDWVQLHYEADNEYDSLEMIHQFQPRIMFLTTDLLPSLIDNYLEQLTQLRGETGIKVILVGTKAQLDTWRDDLRPEACLTNPFSSAMVVAVCHAALHGADQAGGEAENGYKRVAVREVAVRLLRPISELNEVLDLGYNGLTMRSRRLHAEHIGETLNLELIHRHAVLPMEARLLRLDKGSAGLLFTSTKGDQFRRFLEAVAGR